MKSLFDQETYNEIRSRLTVLSENNDRKWGKMTPGQMLHHCQLPLNVLLEKENYGFKPNWLINLFFKKSLYSDKPYRKNLPTAKAFKASKDRDYATEKEVLETLLEEVHAQRDRKDWAPHPAFGEFTPEQYGKMHYKHLDHHLTQFGV